MKRLRILVCGKPNWFDKDAHSAISYYRIAGPLGQLTLDYDWIDVTYSSGGTWPEIANAHIVYLHTPIFPAAVEAITVARSMNKIIWIDFDDMIFAEDIPKSNAAWTFFSGPEQSRNVEYSVKQSTVISCSTQAIKDRIIELYKFPEERIFVIQNALPDGVWRNRNKAKPRDPKEVIRMFWRGSLTHEGDIKKFQTAIRPFPNLGYLFIGHLPWLLDSNYNGKFDFKKGDTFLYEPWKKPIWKYLNFLLLQRPDYMLVVLENNSFNQGKSNIVWLEGTFAGATCIAPATMPEFVRIPSITFETPRQLEKVLKFISSGNGDRMEKYHQSVELIEKEYLLSHTNRIRVELIKSVI